MIISGGIGHSTTFLYAAIAKHPRYHTIPTTGRAEAAIPADIARQFWQIPADRVWWKINRRTAGRTPALAAS